MSGVRVNSLGLLRQLAGQVGITGTSKVVLRTSGPPTVQPAAPSSSGLPLTPQQQDAHKMGPDFLASTTEVGVRGCGCVACVWEALVGTDNVRGWVGGRKGTAQFCWCVYGHRGNKHGVASSTV